MRVVNFKGIDTRFTVHALVRLSLEAGELCRGVSETSQTCAMRNYDVFGFEITSLYIGRFSIVRRG